MLSSLCYVPWTPLSSDDDFVPHPTPVCEPANLAACATPRPSYRLCSSGSGLSTLQRETIQAIVTSFDTRGAFLLGDATGVGKGRIIAGLIEELRLRHGTISAVWVSASTRLCCDAVREFERGELSCL